MLTEQMLAELRMVVATHAAPERREAMLDALDDLQRTIAAQAVVVAATTRELRNRRIGQEAADSIVSASTMDDLATRLGSPRETPFSAAQARAACDALADEAQRGGDLAAIAAAVVRVVRVFV